MPNLDGVLSLPYSIRLRRRYDARVDALLAVPARIHFLSAEPLLGPLRLRHGKKNGLDWVITGGESGPGFREMDLDWARAVRDDCQARGVAFFFKQYSGLYPKKLGDALDGKIH